MKKVLCLALAAVCAGSVLAGDQVLKIVNNSPMSIAVLSSPSDTSPQAIVHPNSSWSSGDIRQNGVYLQELDGFMRETGKAVEVYAKPETFSQNACAYDGGYDNGEAQAIDTIGKQNDNDFVCGKIAGNEPALTEISYFTATINNNSITLTPDNPINGEHSQPQTASFS